MPTSSPMPELASTGRDSVRWAPAPVREERAEHCSAESTAEPVSKMSPERSENQGGSEWRALNERGRRQDMRFKPLEPEVARHHPLRNRSASRVRIPASQPIIPFYEFDSTSTPRGVSKLSPTAWRPRRSSSSRIAASAAAGLLRVDGVPSSLHRTRRLRRCRCWQSAAASRSVIPANRRPWGKEKGCSTSTSRPWRRSSGSSATAWRTRQPQSRSRRRTLASARHPGHLQPGRRGVPRRRAVGDARPNSTRDSARVARMELQGGDACSPGPQRKSFGCHALLKRPADKASELIRIDF